MNAPETFEDKTPAERPAIAWTRHCAPGRQVELNSNR